MKKISVYLMAAFMTLSLSISAQQNVNKSNNKERLASEKPYKAKQDKQSAEERTAWLTKELNLTDQQKADLVEFFKKNDQQKEQHQARQKDDLKKMRDKRQKMREQHRAELEKIIGEKNMGKLDKMREERQNVMKEKRKNMKVKKEHRKQR